MKFLELFNRTKKKIPPRNEFHSSNFPESKARKVVHELENFGYFSLCERDDMELTKEICAFSIYEYGIIGALSYEHNRVIRDFRYLSADGEALMNKIGIKGYLEIILKFMQKHGAPVKDTEFIINKSGFIQKVKINDSIFEIFNADSKPRTEEGFKNIQKNIVLFVNEEFKKSRIDEYIFPTKAGGFYILTKNMFDYFQTLPLAENHRPCN